MSQEDPPARLFYVNHTKEIDQATENRITHDLLRVAADRKTAAFLAAEAKVKEMVATAQEASGGVELDNRASIRLTSQLREMGVQLEAIEELCSSNEHEDIKGTSSSRELIVLHEILSNSSPWR